MTAVLTIHHYIDIINSFVSNVLHSRKAYYVYVGKPDSWIDYYGANTSVPFPTSDSVTQHESQVYKDIIFGKELTANSISYMAPRHDWSNNTVYPYYDQDDGDLYSKAFYVMTDNLEVYKCIDNGGNAPSTVKPTLNSSNGTFQTADNYVWKYMYTIDTANNSNFTSTDFIPVIPNANVATLAVPGSIDAIRLITPGQGYNTYYTGYISGIINDYNISLDRGSSSVKDYYTNSTIYLKSGFGTGQMRKIRAYDGLNRIVNVDQPFDSYTVLNVSDTTGTWAPGDQITQNIDSIAYLYSSGYFSPGDPIVQSDTGANGVIVTANGTSINLVRNSGDIIFTDQALAYPLINQTQSPVLKRGTITVMNTSTLFINSVSGTFLTSDYSVGQYIQIGTNSNNNVRLIESVNSSVIQVDLPFTSALVANVHYLVPYAATPDSIILTSANGYISNTNINGAILQYSNVSVLGQPFIVGEKIDMVDISNTGQAVYGTVSFSNNTTLIVSDINGAGFIGETANTSLRLGFNSNTGIFNLGDVIVDANVSAVGTVSTVTPQVVISFSAISGNVAFAAGEPVYQTNGTSNVATGVVFSYASNTIVISSPTGTWSNSYQVLGNTSHSNGTVSVVSSNNTMVIGSVVGNFIVGDKIINQTNNSSNATITSIYSTNHYIKGESSLQRAHIDKVVGYPNITIKNQLGNFTLGQKIYSRDPISLTQKASANIVSYFNTINESTQYSISPTVNIDGDGQGAMAYSVVNNNVVLYYTKITSNSNFYIGDDITDLTGGATGIITAINSAAMIVNLTLNEFRKDDTITNRTNVGATISQLGKIVNGVSAELYISSANGTFNVGDIIKDVVTGAQGTVHVANSNYLLLSYNNGFFNPGNYFVSTRNVQGQISKAIVSPHNIEKIVITNTGTGYTYANITIQANTLYGNGASAKAVISPVKGHGSDTLAEIGARYAGISMTFDTGYNEGWKFPISGNFGKIGIIQDPKFDDVTVNLDANSFSRIQLGITAQTGIFTTGEIVYQPNTSAAGIVVYSNTTYVELKDVKSEFSNGSHYANGISSNDNIIGLYSGVTANVKTAHISVFTVQTNTEIVTELSSGATGLLQIAYSNTQLKLSNVTGKFTSNDNIYDPITNAVANVISIYTSNGLIDATSNFATKFNQTVRLPLTSNNNSYLPFEQVIQDSTLASGYVIDGNTNLDVVIGGNTTSFIVGDTFRNQINTVSGYITGIANSTYLRLSGVSGKPEVSDTIISASGANATISQVYSVILLDNISGNKFQSGPLTGPTYIVGQTSNTHGQSLLNNTIIYPDLVRGTGDVIYLNNITPFTVNATSKEAVKIVISF